jgi:RHS repeat-associated protein
LFFDTCDFGFTGYYYHATSGLYLSATRAYNPNLGRFISRDPSGESSGLNLYAYCADNPIDFADPSGLAPSAHDQERFDQFADPSQVDINAILDK